MKLVKCYRIIFLVCFLSVLSACKAQTLKTIPLNIDGHDLVVELAVTEQQRATGLMFRKHLAKNHGMLFVFDDEKVRSFWMKNTYIPLSVAYLDKNGVVRSIHDMTPLSLESTRSKGLAQYALEVNKGYFDEIGLKVGDKITLPRTFS